MKKNVWMLAASFLLFAACDKKENAVKENGVVIAVNDQTGCGFVINLDSGKKIEPINTEEADVEALMVNNKRVSVEYRLRKDFETPCQNADPAQILEINAISQ